MDCIDLSEIEKKYEKVYNKMEYYMIDKFGVIWRNMYAFDDLENFFEEHGVIISIYYLNSTRNGAWKFTIHSDYSKYSYNNTFASSYYATKSEAKIASIIKSFQIMKGQF